MKVGDKLYCINNESFDDELLKLTIRKTYIVLDIDKNSITIKNDGGYFYGLNKKLITKYFMSQSEYRDMKLNKLLYENRR